MSDYPIEFFENNVDYNMSISRPTENKALL